MRRGYQRSCDVMLMVGGLCLYSVCVRLVVSVGGGTLGGNVEACICTINSASNSTLCCMRRSLP